MELAPEVKKLGLKNVFVTNGFISPKPLETFLEFGDAFNIDLKSFNGNFYKNICGGSLKPVLETIKTVSEKAHLELTTLVIPGLNDSKEDFENLREWIVDNAGKNVPVHLSKYYPTYKLNLPGTPIGTLNKARDILRKKLRKSIIDDNPVVQPGCHFNLVNDIELFDYWYGSGNGKWGSGPKEKIPTFQMDSIFMEKQSLNRINSLVTFLKLRE